MLQQTKQSLSACSRAFCACRRRQEHFPVLPTPVVDGGCWYTMLRPFIFLDGSALVQTSDIPHVDVLNQPKLGFTARDASWEATSDTANAWLQLARDGRLGKLWPRVVHTATRRHIFAGLSHFLYAVCGVVSAVVLLTGVQRGIANYNTDPNALSYLIIYAFALFVSDLLRILLNSHTRIESRRASHTMQHALQAAVLLKAAELGPGQVSDGDVVTLLNSDSLAVLSFGERVNLVWVLPLEIVGICAVLIANAGIPGVAAVIAIFILLSAQIGLSTRNGPVSSAIRSWQGKLLAMTTDVMRSIRAIKMAAWESSLLPHIFAVRSQQLKAISNLTWLSTGFLLITLAIPMISMFAAVVTAYVGGIQLQPSFIATVALFGQLRTALLSWAPSLRMRAGAVVAVEKIEEFLNTPTPRIGSKDSCVIRGVTNAVAHAPAPPAIKAEESAVVEVGSVQLSDDLVSTTWRERAGKSAPSFPSSDIMIAVSGATCEWFSVAEKAAKSFSLRELTFSVPRGSVLGLTGAAGSGKSALMSMLLGDMKHISGAALVRGRIAFTSQAVWLEPGSIRDNVLFGLPMRDEWYATVLKVCCLDRDIGRMDDGDRTLVGERGGKLSGGQQARIALARAVYADADVYLLDDPVAALDNAVAARVWQQCIRDTLVARGKCVIFVSQRVGLLEKCDNLLILSEGAVAFLGPPSAIPPEFAAAGRMTKAPSTAEEAPESNSGNVAPEATSASDTVSPRTLELKQQELRHTEASLKGNSMFFLQKAATARHVAPRRPSVAHDSLAIDVGATVTVVDTADAKLQNSGESSSVPLSEFIRYLCGDRGVAMLLVVFTAILGAGTGTINAWWLSVLLSGVRKNPTADGQLPTWLLPIYAATAAAFLIALFYRGAVFHSVTLHASYFIHRDALLALFRAPLRYFLITPAGKLLTILSNDLMVLDTGIPNFLEMGADQGISILGSVLLIMSIFPAFIPVVAFAFVLVVVVADMNNRVVVPYARLELTACAPLASHVGAILSGGQVMRTSGRQGVIVAQAKAMIEGHSSANMATCVLSRWQGVRLEFIAALLLLATALFCAGSGGSLDAPLAGLAIGNALSLGSLLPAFANNISAILSCFASVERVDALSRVEAEEHWPEPGHGVPPPCPGAPVPDAALVAAARAPKRSAARKARYPYAGWDPECWVQKHRAMHWPHRGGVHMDHVTARYVPGAPPALKGVSVNIKERSALGIIGRSGSGKSTLGLVLLRLIEADPPPENLGSNLNFGKIMIDGVDTSTVPLAQLRSGIGCVPQEPMIIGGLTVAQNLDPTGEKSHDAMWDALEECGIASVIRSMPQGLDTPMKEGGSDMAAGNRQLLCFARVLLFKPRIIMLDEATASLDNSSDQAILRAIIACSHNSTIFNIAHRLNTIMPGDRVLSMDAGEVVDFDSPSALLHISKPEEPPIHHPKSGALVELVGRSGPEEELELRSMAAAGYLRRRLITKFHAKRMKALVAKKAVADLGHALHMVQ